MAVAVTARVAVMVMAVVMAERRETDETADSNEKSEHVRFSFPNSLSPPCKVSSRAIVKKCKTARCRDVPRRSQRPVTCFDFPGGRGNVVSMITRIEIDGFKSLRDFAVDLDPLTVFIGPNNAGKSNILEALALLSRLCSQRIDEAFKGGRGSSMTQFTRTGGEPGSTIRFAVELLLPQAFDSEGAPVPNRCRYELVVERRSYPSGSEYLAIPHEALWTLDRASDRWIDAHADLTRFVHHAAERACLFEQAGEDEGERVIRSPRVPLPEAEVRFPHGPTLLFALRVTRDVLMRNEALSRSSQAGVFQMAADALSAFRLLHLAPAALRASSERIGVATLAPDGSNLPTVLASLPAPILGELRADIVSVVPGLSSFEIVPDGDELRIEFVLAGGERLPAELSSDGTLRILALLTALRVQPRPAVIGVDELENGIYPGRLRQLLSLLQETVALTDDSDSESASQLPIQLLMTTHSPVMLDAFRSRLPCLRFIDLVRRDRQLMTRARPVCAEAGPDRGRLTVSLREIDELLQSADSEMASSV